MYARQEKPLPNSYQHLVQFCKAVLLGAMLLGCIFLINQIHLSHYFLIKEVRVYGMRHTEQNEVQDLLKPLVARGFFSINVEYIRERLLQLPWVADISVRRLWPNQIEITILEKKPIARWDKVTLLSDTGVLFTPKKTNQFDQLPLFDGPSGKQILMLNYFNEMNRLLIPLRVKISYLELTPYLTWKMKLNNGITLQIGHKDILTRLNHFVKVYPKIIGDRATGVDSVDLRYPNGVAVHWKVPINT